MVLNGDLLLCRGFPYLITLAKHSSTELELCSLVQVQRIKQSLNFKVETALKSPCDGGRKQDNACFPCSLLVQKYSARENKYINCKPRDYQGKRANLQGNQSQVIFSHMVPSSTVDITRAVRECFRGGSVYAVSFRFRAKEDLQRCGYCMSSLMF